MLVLLFGFWGAQTAYAGVTITPTTWDVVGKPYNFLIRHVE